MGPFHGRRKPSAKKSAKPKGDSAEEIAARQARDQFIKDMAAKALPSAADADTGGIHPSRLARADPFSGGQPNKAFSQHRQEERPTRGQRAPDLRSQGNKRTFDESNSGNMSNQGPMKKQRTLEDIRRLKGPAAMKKEEEKRRRKEIEVPSKSQLEPSASGAVPNTTSETRTGNEDDDDDSTPIPSKKGKKGITKVSASVKTPEEKAQRKAEKAARKLAKKSATNGAPSEEPSAHAVAANEEQTSTEGELPIDPAVSIKEALSEENFAMKEKKERKEKKEKKKSETAEVEGAEDTAEKKSARRAAKKEKNARKAAEANEVSSVSEIPKPISVPVVSSQWSSAASSLGSKSSKFMRLLGGAKHADQPMSSVVKQSGTDDHVAQARKAEKALQKQYMAGVQSKHSGQKRSGLGA